MRIKVTYHDANIPVKEIVPSVKNVGEENLSKLSMVKNLEKNTKKEISRLKKIKNGIMGITNATLGIGLASDMEIEVRRSICNGCRFRNGKSCGSCGCLIHPKTKLAKEECPMGFWGQSITIENKRSGGCGCGKNNY